MAGSKANAGSFAEQAKALYISAANKGGMDGIDTEKIAQIQLETASSSTFTDHQKQLNAAVDERVRRLKEVQARLVEPQVAAEGGPHVVHDVQAAAHPREQ